MPAKPHLRCSRRAVNRMGITEFNKTKVIKYLVFTFGVAYLIQIGVWMLYKSGNQTIGQLVMAAMMFIPLLGVLAAGEKLTRMGWRPEIRKNIKYILPAWFGPAILTAIGAALYFLVFPDYFDLSGSAMEQSVGSEAFAQLEEQGLSYSLLVLINIVSAVTYAPLVNAVVSMGEEVGWRGFLYPQLKAKYGRRKGWILGGIIWGAWHWPIIWLIGYEYGLDYIGFPVVGMLVFCIFTVAIGILCDWLYERSGTIWLPSLIHGTFNAAAGIPLMVCVVAGGSARLLGPAPNGMLAGLPLLIVAAILYKKGR